MSKKSFLLTKFFKYSDNKRYEKYFLIFCEINRALMTYCFFILASATNYSTIAA